MRQLPYTVFIEHTAQPSTFFDLSLLLSAFTRLGLQITSGRKVNLHSAVRLRRWVLRYFHSTMSTHSTRLRGTFIGLE